MMKRRISLLGSTGSIGLNTLEIIRRNPRCFEVVGLSAHTNIELLARQIKLFKPQVVAIKDEVLAARLRQQLKGQKVKILIGREGLKDIACLPATEILVVATSGSSSLIAVLEAIKRKKIIALANKEPMVMAGEIISRLVKQYQTKIIPIDSEHSAVFQCLQGRDKAELKKIYLTASGGPFYCCRGSLKNISPAVALKHPRWNMGKKVTIDSATMMNKGLEIMEARWLFDLPVDKIEVLIHPEAIIHSMIELTDGAIIAQLGVTDMRLPIQYALTYPRRANSDRLALDFSRVKALTFARPDSKRFPCLKIAREAAMAGGVMPAVLNAANEVLVDKFLKRDIKFTQIAEYLEKILKNYKNIAHPDLEQILAADCWAREETQRLC